MNDFAEISAKYAPPSCNSRKFTARDYFTAMLFGQLSGAMSLRELEIGLATAGGKIIHTGGKPMKRTTLAYNNNQAQPEFYKQFYFRFLSKVRHDLIPSSSRRHGKSLFSLDSTTITLGCKLFSWANFKHNKKGIKLHTALSNETIMPEVIVTTVAKRADVKCAKAAIEQLPADSIVVMDRGYNDYKLFAWLDQRGTTFVTRLKKNALHTSLREGAMGHSETWGDYITTFTSAAAKKACGDKVWRVIQWYDEIENRWFEFITNDYEAHPTVIAELYRERWKVELFFKKIKHNLIVKTFYGTTENAVLSQVWIAMTAALLLEVLRQRSKRRWHFSTLAWVIRQSLWGYDRLDDIINQNLRFPCGTSSEPALPLQLEIAF